MVKYFLRGFQVLVSQRANVVNAFSIVTPSVWSRLNRDHFKVFSRHLSVERLVEVT
jgi:hypothetical protein